MLIKFFNPRGISFANLAVRLFVALSAVYWVLPIFRKPLVREDNLLEMITAVLFLAIAVLSVRFIRKTALRQRHWSDYLIPLLATLGFLEEVSFGRLFFNELPIVHGVKIDAVHDFLRVGLALMESDRYQKLIESFVIIAFTVSLIFVYLFREKWLALLGRNTVKLCMTCLGLVAAASILDLGLVQHHYLVFLEEFLEMLAAIALLYAYWALQHRQVKTSLVATKPVDQAYTNRAAENERVALDAQAN